MPACAPRRALEDRPRYEMVRQDRGRDVTALSLRALRGEGRQSAFGANERVGRSTPSERVSYVACIISKDVLGKSPAFCHVINPPHGTWPFSRLLRRFERAGQEGWSGGRERDTRVACIADAGGFSFAGISPGLPDERADATACYG